MRENRKQLQKKDKKIHIQEIKESKERQKQYIKKIKQYRT
jgi:hypothetical protein